VKNDCHHEHNHDYKCAVSVATFLISIGRYMSKNGRRSRMSEHNTQAIVPITGGEQEN